MNALQQGKVNAILSKKYRYEEGIMTRKEWIELMKANGATVKVGEKCPIQWNRRKFNRMDYKEQAVYNKRLEERVPCYELYRKGETNIFTEITKTEYDYFLSL